MANEEQKLGLGKEEEGVEMTPWEQHSAVISIPRYDYNAPSSLVNHTHCGFLITCPIKREKSATKEAISILAKYVASLRREASEGLEGMDANVAVKRRKTCSEEIDREEVNGAENREKTDETDIISEETCSTSTKRDIDVEKGLLSLVKLTRSGLLLFTFPRDNSPDTVDIVSNLFHSVESGNLRSLSWCHRIFPIQATCRLNEEDLRIVVQKLVQQFLDNKQNKFERPIKFAVGFDRRGMDEKEMKIQKCGKQEGSISSALLDRNKCFAVVASAVKETIPDSVVDLKSPEIAILIEMLPLSGIQNGLSVVAVSVLPNNLIRTKPRLCIKALVSDSKTTNGKS